MKKLKSLATIFALTLGMSLLSGCGTQPAETETLPEVSEVVEPVGTLTLPTMSASGAAPVIIAQEQGLFEKYGLTVEHVNTGDPTQLVSALQAGEVDGAGSDIITAINLNAGGFKTYITSKTDGRFMVVSNQSLEELKASDQPIKVGISKNNIIEYVGDEYFKSVGIDMYDPTQVELVVLPKPPARLEMLKNNQIDVAVLNETLGVSAVATGSTLLANSDELGIQAVGMIFSEKTITEKTAELESFYKAYNDAVDYINNTDPSEYMDMVIEKAKYPEDVKGELELPVYTKAMLPSEDQYVSVNEWMNKIGMTDQVFDYKDVTTDSFLQ